MPRRAKPIPSDQFISAIARGYDSVARWSTVVSASDIWDQVVNECLRVPEGFTAMFAWDTRSGPRNRIGTIRDTIAAGLVPGLALARNAKGREVVIREACRG